MLLASHWLEVRVEASLRVNIYTDGSVRIIELFDNLVAEETESMRDYLETEIQEGHVRLILDFARVDYMCSFALGALVNMLKKVRASGGDLKLTRVNSWLKNLLSIAQVSKVIDIYDTVPEAVKAFSALPFPAEQ